ncbi:hypothetical protein M3Y99_01018600 [Aphelenchoides fujianensis]|nr:hypothetical protein M3Y99_01018600 [Aphelenchoides fujianensis]
MSLPLANFPKVDDWLRVLGSYAGRDKVLRSVCFGLLLTSTKTKRKELAEGLQVLAGQISKARTVCRQLNHLPLMVATSKLKDAVKVAGDKVDAEINLFVMAAYVVYQFCELAAWLADAKVVAWSAAPFLRWAIYSWVAALAAGILQILRRILVVEPVEDRATAPEKTKLAARRMDRITLVGLLADFVGGVNLLPHRVLWAGRLNQRTSSTFFLIASLIGLYKMF